MGGLVSLLVRWWSIIFFIRSPSITFGSTTLTNTSAGIYDAFLVKYDDSGSGDLFLAKLNDNITGIGEFPVFTGLSLFPNPASDRITIATLPGAATGEVTVFNLAGQEYLHQDVTGTTPQIDISALPSGLYFAKLVRNQGVLVGKFMKNWYFSFFGAFIPLGKLSFIKSSAWRRLLYIQQ